MTIVEKMEEYQGKRVVYVDNLGNKHSGYIDVFETAYDNEDEGDEASICIERDDGKNLIVYESEIKDIYLI